MLGTKGIFPRQPTLTTDAVEPHMKKGDLQPGLFLYNPVMKKNTPIEMFGNICLLSIDAFSLHNCLSLRFVLLVERKFCSIFS